MSGRLLLAAGLIFLALPASAGPYEDALAAYDRGDLTNAAKLYRTAAEQGHAYAQVSLGLMYEFGKGVSKDSKEAIRLYRLAAAQGEPQAFTLLGVMTQVGEGVEADIVRAFMWYWLAAQKEPNRAIDRDLLEGKLTFAQVATAKELAAACVAKQFTDC